MFGFTRRRAAFVAAGAALAGIGLSGCGVSTSDSADGVGPGFFSQCDERYIPVQIFIANDSGAQLSLDYQHAYQVLYQVTSDQVAPGDSTEVVACVLGNTDSGGASQMDTDGLDLQYVDSQGNAWNLFLSAQPSNASNAGDRDGRLVVRTAYNSPAKDGAISAQADVVAGYVPGNSGSITQMQVTLSRPPSSPPGSV